MFFFSAYPSSRRPRWNAWMRVAVAEGEVAARNPIRGIFFGCCASARTLRARSRTQGAIEKTFLFIVVSLASRVSPHDSFDQLIRPIQNRLRNDEADLPGCFEIDDKLELRRLLHREVGGIR